MILNFLNNNLFPKYPHDYKFLKIKNFEPQINKKDWEIMSKSNTPSRMLGDIFWLKLSWKILKNEVGPINIFDTGCGDGKYAIMLKNFSNGYENYTGVDSFYNLNWNKISRDKSINLKKLNSNSIEKIIPKKTNLFITQSAIEHFENDLYFFEQISNFIIKTKKNIVQIHLFPSPPSLWLYLTHGVRQYNMRNIKKIIDIFEGTNSYARLFPIGGRFSNKLHFDKITKEELFLGKKNNNSYRFVSQKKYFNESKNAILKDIKYSNINSACFYALIIHSNYRNIIFN
ncbi:hypothetical protein [Prochlorococcus marinus]|uniref:hypothetical protein n=1 Tax=Prochlorococcus marinus TaxID=1219 RepID=UPI001C5A04EE|nr:hypothetical protein [Prochlorococcus marinus]